MRTGAAEPEVKRKTKIAMAAEHEGFESKNCPDLETTHRGKRGTHDVKIDFPVEINKITIDTQRSSNFLPLLIIRNKNSILGSLSLN
jgi:hypothetical protein